MPSEPGPIPILWKQREENRDYGNANSDQGKDLTKRKFQRVRDDPVSLDSEFSGDDYVHPLGDVQEHDCADGICWAGIKFMAK